MTTTLPTRSASCAAIGHQPFELTRIFEPEIQVAQWRRPEDTLITQWLDEHANRLGGGLRQVLAPGQPPDLACLPAGLGRDALGADLQLLAEVLADLLDAPKVGLRLEILLRAMCPRFHVDRVGVRLLCTYRGPGTEWVEEASVDRRHLSTPVSGLPGGQPGLLRPGYRIETIPAFTVALLKGTLWQGNSGRGILHRSPAATQPPRVLVAMDAFGSKVSAVLAGKPNWQCQSALTATTRQTCRQPRSAAGLFGGAEHQGLLTHRRRVALSAFDRGQHRVMVW